MDSASRRGQRIPTRRIAEPVALMALTHGGCRICSQIGSPDPSSPDPDTPPSSPMALSRVAPRRVGPVKPWPSRRPRPIRPLVAARPGSFVADVRQFARLKMDCRVAGRVSDPEQRIEPTGRRGRKEEEEESGGEFRDSSPLTTSPWRKKPHEPDAPARDPSIPGGPRPTPSRARRAPISRAPQPRGRRRVTDVRGRWCAARSLVFGVHPRRRGDRREEGRGWRFRGWSWGLWSRPHHPSTWSVPAPCAKSG